MREYFFDRLNRCTIQREYTGRADPTLPTTETANRPKNKLRPGDPEFFQTRYEYNADSQRTRITHPNGNITENVYEADLNPVAAPRSRGNLRIVRQLPVTHLPRGDQAVIEEFFEYDEDFGCGQCGFNFVTRHVDGRGNETVSEYDENGNLTRTGHRISSIVENFEYNAFGQMTVHTLPDNGSGHRRRDEYIYYASGAQMGYLKDEIIDANNLALTTTYEYNLVGNVITHIDPRGHDTQYIVNELDRVVREISREVGEGAASSTPTDVRYQRDTFYDANNNVIQRDTQNIDEAGNLLENTHFTETYEYEILNYLVRQTQEVGAPLAAPNEPQSIVTEHAYDGNRNRILTRYGEATNGNQPANVVEMQYDERDLLYREVRAPGDPDQSTMQYDYDGNENVIRTVHGLEENPRVTEYDYDGYNRRASEIDPMGNVTAYGYDANHNPVRVRHDGELVDVAGSVDNVRLSDTTYTYDAMDRLVREDAGFFDTESQDDINDGVAVTLTEYSDSSQVVRVVDDNGHETLTSYDTANRTRLVTDAKGNTIEYTYDANSNAVETIETEKSDLGNPDEAFTTTYAYDNLDRLIQTVDNVGNANSFGYDSRDNRTLHTDALGNITRYVYDGLNRLTDTMRELTNTGDGLGAVVDTITTTQAWDDTSRLIGQTDDNGNTTAYTYDALNRKIATTYADGTVHTTTYDVHDTAVEMLDANGSVVTCAYDLNDRLTLKEIVPGPGVSDDTTFEEYAYDGLSRIVSAKDDDSTVARSYDSLSRVTSETLNGGTTTSVYDGVGNMLSCAYPGGRVVETTYDELDRKKEIINGLGLIARYDYIGPARVEQRDYGNETRTTYAYDGVKRLTRTTHTRDPEGVPETFDDRTYAWDAMYNKIARNDLIAGRNRTFTYDSVYRLTRSTGGPTGDVDYTLDGVGNREEVVGGSNSGLYTMDNPLPEPGDFQLNQYTTTPSDAREYDKNGNLIQIGADRELVYDYRNQMVGYTDFASGVASSYRYDAFGRRIEKMVDDNGLVAVTTFFYQGWQVVEERDGGGLTAATYVYGLYIDEALNMQRGGADFFYHADDLYNVVKVTDALGAVAEAYDYEDYGSPVILAQSGVGNPYLFTGRRYDGETGWYYYRTRYLDSMVGRFTVRDTIGIWGDISNIGNGYTYVANSPTTFTDPLGEKTCQECQAQWEARKATCFIKIPQTGPGKPDPLCVVKAYIKLLICLFSCKPDSPTPNPNPPCLPPDCYCGI